MWHISLKNKHGDFYHETFRTLTEFFSWLEERIGEENVVRMRCRWVPGEVVCK